MRERHVPGGLAADEADALVEEQDEAERGQHLIEMVAPIERAQHDDLDGDADQRRRRQGEQEREHERPGPGREDRGEVGADHVERSVGEVDQVHDPEHEGQAGRHEEEHDAELQAVEALDDEEAGIYQSCFVARRAPSAIALNFAHTTVGCTSGL